MKDPKVSRRTVLLGTSVGLAASLVPEFASAADVGVSVLPFPLNAVTLQAGPFQANRDRTLSYLSFVDADRLLHTFRLNVGLTSTAQAVGGWESPTTELRGHSTGHLLTALAQAYASTGDAQYKTKGDYIVSVLAQCQSRAAQSGFNTGYVSAYPESFIDRVEARQTVWAPYYTLHKIMQGLLDMNLLTGNTQALNVLTAQAAWVKFRMDRLTQAQRQSMLQTEFGGMNEVLANLYLLTGNAAHLTTAQYFDHAQIFDPLALNQDRLAGFHANTQIPKAIGAIREYHATGTTRYRDIAVNFWDIVLRAHTYAIGGNSNGEYFQTPNAIASQLSDSTCETCNTYNMLKLTRQLFFTNPSRLDYLDYHEKALFNQILGQQNPSSAHGFVAYYQPLRPGGIKTYSNDYNSFTCDHGTGMESNTKYQDSIYYVSTDGNTLYVNLFIASTLNWAARGITLRQETTWPESPTSRLTVASGSGTFTMRVRIPGWAPTTQVRVNGIVQPSGVITRTWAAGDVIDIATPMALSFEATPDNPNVRAVKHGPIVLAGAYGTNNLSAMPSLTQSSLAATATPMQYTGTASTGSVTLFPFYKMHGQRYNVYWNITGAPLPAFVAHYQFDETSGTSAADATGNGKTASVVGGTWTAGRIGNAVNLSGSSQYVSIPAGVLAGASACTIATWVRLDTIANWTRIFDLGTGTTANMFLTPSSSAGTARFAITSSGAGGEQRVNAPAAIPTGAWTHVAVTLSGGTGILYVNKAEVARASITLTPASLGSTSQNWIGRSQYSGDPFLDGAVDDFRLYSRALSASEISALP